MAKANVQPAPTVAVGSLVRQKHVAKDCTVFRCIQCQEKGYVCPERGLYKAELKNGAFSNRDRKRVFERVGRKEPGIQRGACVHH